LEERSPLLRGRFRDPLEIGDDGLVSVLTDIFPAQVSVATGIFVTLLNTQQKKNIPRRYLIQR
jgi:hypothetical protein